MKGGSCYFAASLPFNIFSMTKINHNGHLIVVIETGVETSGLKRGWDFLIDGFESESSYGSESAAITAAKQLAERLPVLV